MRSGKLHPEQIQAIVARCAAIPQSRETVSRIAVAFNVHRSTVVHHAERLGVLVVQHKPPEEYDDAPPSALSYEARLAREEGRRRERQHRCAHTMLKCPGCGMCRDNMLTDQSQRIRQLSEENETLRRQLRGTGVVVC